MNTLTPQVRAVASQALIALSLCAGAYMALVEPAERRLTDLRAEVARRQAEAAQCASSTMSISQLTALRDACLQTTNQLQTRNTESSSEARLFESLVKLAGQSGVRVESMNPSTVGPARKPGLVNAPQPMDAAARNLDDRRYAYSLRVQCNYDQLVRFVESLQSGAGFANIRAVRLTPSSEPGSRLLSATIETEHLWFDLSAVNVMSNAEVRR
ncbi:MAG: hypothetical protein IBJ18_02910 [Phycisphaerales bacterium]|nr:hypothetical protein [Phycisphaerales bacterium]